MKNSSQEPQGERLEAITGSKQVRRIFGVLHERERVGEPWQPVKMRGVKNEKK